MVVTIYADRPATAVANAAAMLAASFARAGAHRVALIAHATPTEVPGDVAFHAMSATDANAFPALLVALRRQHDIIVLAPAHGSSEHTFLALDHADNVLLLSDLSVAALRDLQRTLRLCVSLGHPYDKPRVVLHGVNAGGDVAPNEAAAAVKREIYWQLPALDSPAAAENMDGLALKLIAEKRLGDRRLND